MQFDQCIRPSTLGEAAQLLSEPGTAVLGGGAWARFSRKKTDRALDLSHLGLDKMEERDGLITLGAMTPLRAVETSPLLQELAGGILPRSIEHIVGVQLRNIITVGGTLAGRYGFSDLLTALLVLPAEVLVYGEEPVPMEDWLRRRASERTLVTGVQIRRDGRRASFQGVRRTSTDFSLLNAAASLGPEGDCRIAVGARPAGAVRVPEAEKIATQALSTGAPSPAAAPAGISPETAQKAGEAAAQLTFKDDLRAGAAYRRKICPVLIRRALQEASS